MLNEQVVKKYKDIEERLSFLRSQMRKLERERNSLASVILEGLGDRKFLRIGDFCVEKTFRTEFRPSPLKVYQEVGWDRFLRMVKVLVGELKKEIKDEEKLKELGVVVTTPKPKVYRIGEGE